MLAHGLLTVIAANEHNARPAPAGLIALTCNEIARLLTALVVGPARVPACPHAWSTWRDAINTAPAPATTTAKKQPSSGHNDLRLEY